MMTLAERIRSAREAKGWDQARLAAEVGYSQPAVSDIETGNTPAPRKWRQLADILDIPHDEFRQLMVIAGRAAGKTTRLPTAVREVLERYALPTQIPVALSPADRASLTPNARLTGSAVAMDRDTVPVFGRAAGGDDGRYLFNGEVIGWAPRPINLVGVSGVYGVYIDGDSMYPRYKTGETAIAQPGRGINKGDDVIVQLAPDEDGESPYGFVKEFVGYTPTKIVLSQFNPPMKIEFDRERVLSVHRIVHADR